jgi:mitochondrial chaperone BCS1
MILDLHTIINDFVTQIRNTLSHNQFATGGFVLMLVGGVAAYARNLPNRIYSWLKERLIITVEVRDEERAFAWLQRWLSQQRAAKNMRSLTLVTSHRDPSYPIELGLDEDGDMLRAALNPIEGTYFVRFQGRMFWFSPEREKMQRESLLIGFDQRLYIRTLITNRQAINTLIHQAYLMSNKRDQCIDIMVAKQDRWDTVERKIPRKPSSLVYQAGLFEQLQADVEAFIAEAGWYREMGIPHRRGYLLYGPPGNGKSSVVAALAGVVGSDVCILNLSSSRCSDENMTTLLANAPEKAIILLEDIDAVFEGRKKNKTNNNALSFHGLLNALDGVAAQENRLVFMTTNHRDLLDAALIRPGRCDVHLFIGNANTSQMIGMLNRFFPRLSQASAEDLAARIPEHSLSMAQVQEFLLRYRHDEAALTENWLELELLGLAGHPESPKGLSEQSEYGKLVRPTSL